MLFWEVLSIGLGPKKGREIVLCIRTLSRSFSQLETNKYVLQFTNLQYLPYNNVLNDPDYPKMYKQSAQSGRNHSASLINTRVKKNNQTDSTAAYIDFENPRLLVCRATRAPGQVERGAQRRRGGRETAGQKWRRSSRATS